MSIFWYLKKINMYWRKLVDLLITFLWMKISLSHSSYPYIQITYLHSFSTLILDLHSFVCFKWLTWIYRISLVNIICSSSLFDKRVIAMWQRDSFSFSHFSSNSSVSLLFVMVDKRRAVNMEEGDAKKQKVDEVSSSAVNMGRMYKWMVGSFCRSNHCVGVRSGTICKFAFHI